ncbi:MAG: hypothetical protein RL115_1450 [Bacteroidota bacterium]|jgi:hypothetical protein
MINDAWSKAPNQSSKDEKNEEEEEEEPSETLPVTADNYNVVYNNGQPYSAYKPCGDKDGNGNLLYFNQCNIRASNALRACGMDLSKVNGARCSHGDLLRVAEFNKYLANNFEHIELTNANQRVNMGNNVRHYLKRNQLSALVVLLDFQEPSGNGRVVSGNHIEFVYKGTPKSTFENVWRAKNFFIYFFKAN